MGDFEIDEGPDNYFKNLDKNDRQWSLQEEKYYRKNLGLRILTDFERHKLEETPQGE